MAKPPILSKDERIAALAKAANFRKARADFKESIRTGECSWRDALSSKNEAILRMRVKELIEAIPGFGSVRALAILDRIGISHSRRIKGLGVSQRVRLLEELRGR